jgi:hypothetical protein
VAVTAAYLLLTCVLMASEQRTQIVHAVLFIVDGAAMLGAWRFWLHAGTVCEMMHAGKQIDVVHGCIPRSSERRAAASWPAGRRPTEEHVLFFCPSPTHPPPASLNLRTKPQ